MTVTRQQAYAAFNKLVEGASSGVCCCGDDMKQHSNPMDCGHTPVDSGIYSNEKHIGTLRAYICGTESDRRSARANVALAAVLGFYGGALYLAMCVVLGRHYGMWP